MRKCLPLLSIVVFGLQSVTHAAEIDVPKDYPTIQQAIDAAAPGDTVTVAPGKYVESLQFKGGITLRGTSRLAVVVECEAASTAVITVEKCDTGSVESITFHHTGADKVAKDAKRFCVTEVKDSSVAFEDCDFSGSPVNGAHMRGTGTPSFRRCSFHDNGDCGVCVEGPDVNAVIEDNACANNKGSGIAIIVEKTKAMVSGNAAVDNGVCGIWTEHRASIDGTNNFFARNGEVSEYEINHLFWQKQFTDLENMVSRIRTEKLRYQSGAWQLTWYYDEFTDYAGQFDEIRDKEFLTRIHLWQKAFPDSITWRIILTDYFMAKAWQSRGGGYANEVSDEGWRGYRSNMDSAWAMLSDAAKCPVKDPEYYVKLCALSMESPREQKNIPLEIAKQFLKLPSKDEVTKAFEEGIKLEPAYEPLYNERVRCLLPRWHGSVPEIMALANKLPASMSPEAADTVYAAIASQTLQYEGEDAFRQSYSFSWERIQKGSERAIEQFPQSDYLKNRYIRMACVHRDSGVAKRMFEQTGEAWEENVWRSKAEYDAFRAWAEGKGPYPEISPLEKAVQDGDVMETERLLAKGADPKSVSRAGQSLISIAVSRGNVSLANALLNAGADPNAQNVRGSGIIFSTLNNTSDEMLSLLLSKGANPNVTDGYGWTPISVAIEWDHPGFVPILLNHGADPNAPSTVPPLHNAVRKGYRELVPLLLEHKADPNQRPTDSPTPLAYAVEQREYQVVKLLIDHGADINLDSKDGWTPLFAAADAGDIELGKLLIGRGADIHKRQNDGWTVFHMAVMNGHLDMLEYLLGVAPEGLHELTDNKYTLLHTAAKNGKVDILQFLIEKGLDVNAKVDGGDTAIKLSHERKHDEVERILREHGATQ